MFDKPLTLNDHLFLSLLCNNSTAHLYDDSRLLFASTSWTDLLYLHPLPLLKNIFSAILCPYGNEFLLPSESGTVCLDLKLEMHESHLIIADWENCWINSPD